MFYSHREDLRHGDINKLTTFYCSHSNDPDIYCRASKRVHGPGAGSRPHNVRVVSGWMATVWVSFHRCVRAISSASWIQGQGGTPASTTTPGLPAGEPSPSLCGEGRSRLATSSRSRFHAPSDGAWNRPPSPGGTNGIIAVQRRTFQQTDPQDLVEIQICDLVLLFQFTLKFNLYTCTEDESCWLWWSMTFNQAPPVG